ncbi:alpha/beta hydrolase [soil metagenome]
MTLAVDPAMAPILERLLAAPAVDYASISLAEGRTLAELGATAWNEPRLPMAKVLELTIPGAAGPMRARLYRPVAGRLPLILFAHGGGWTFGSIDTHDCEMRGLAAASGAAVLGFDYRRATENPFPAPTEDVVAAIGFVEDGGLGPEIDATRMAVAGDSAGANLALGALLSRRDQGARPLAAAALFYGCYAPDFDTPSHARCGDGSFGLSSVRMRWYWQNFLGRETFAAESLAVPLRQELGGLPPLYLVGAGLDPLLDDTIALSRRLAAAGVRHRLDVVPGVIHGFMRMGKELPAARRAVAAGGGYLGVMLKTTPMGGLEHGTQDIP